VKLTAIDFETANSNPASVCAVGISVMEDGAVEEKYYSLIRPEENVSWFSRMNISVHGIHPEEVTDAPDFRAVYHEMAPYFEDAVVIAHNARFDMGCLKAACLNTGIAVPHLHYFDTVELSRKVFRSLPRHRLNDLCDYLGVELNHHNALSDSYGCLMIAVSAMNLTGVYDPEELCSVCNIRMKEL
jgi:DNA polymerase-3 subunit epsilon